MKKVFRILCAVALVVSLVSCGEKDKDASFSLSGINLGGVKYLALGSQGSGAKGGTQSMLYSIDENGNMQLVAYEYDCDEEGLVT